MVQQATTYALDIQGHALSMMVFYYSIFYYSLQLNVCGSLVLRCTGNFSLGDVGTRGGGELGTLLLLNPLWLLRFLESSL